MPHIVVVGGGVAGLAAAWKLTRDVPGSLSGEPGDSGRLRVTLVEAAPRFGGKIVTERVDGFLIEGGADSFAARKPRGVGLVRELGLEGRLIATGASRSAFPVGPVEPVEPAGPRRSNGSPEREPAGGGGVHLALGDRLVPLPEGLSLVVPTRLGPVLRSPLLSTWGKLRVVLDLVMPRRAGAHHSGRHGDRPPQGGASAALPDESVAELVRRRFGAEYLERVAGPLLGGIHSSDPEELSIEAAFPHLAALERRHRSLLLGVRRMNGAGPVVPSSERGGPPEKPPGGGVPRDMAAARVSLAGGMGELVDALVARLREEAVDLLSGCSVSGLEPGSDSAWTVHLADGRRLAADAVVLAAPPPVAAALLEGLGGPTLGAVETLRQIPQVSTATISFGLPRSALGRELRGMGFLVPRSEGRLVSACTFSSLKFPDRAPDGSVLLRAFVGAHGGFRPEDLDDEALSERVRAELAEILRLASDPPVVTRVHRFVEANPQYRVGHAQRVRTLEAALPPGLLLAGCGYHGLGVPDCVASGERAARAALQAVAP